MVDVERGQLAGVDTLIRHRRVDELREAFDRGLGSQLHAQSLRLTRQARANGAPTASSGFPARSYNSVNMVCPRCRQRKARRACPALGHQICAVCCGTERLVEIACPSDCPYLASAREHPPAAAVRQQQDDLSAVVRAMRDLNERQSRLFFIVLTFLARYEPAELHPLRDGDIADAMAALAATSETAARGVIYEHRAGSLPAERLVGGLTPVLAEAGQTGGTPFQRDAAVVLRRVEGAAREAMGRGVGQSRRFVDLVRRMIRKPEAAGGDAAPLDEGPRVIIP